MKRLLFVLISCVSLPIAAQDKSKEAKVEELLRLTKADALLEQMSAQMRKMAASQIPPDATDAQKAAISKGMERVFDLVQQRLSWAELKPLYIKLYSENFSDEDLDGILGFYRTPAGKALLNKMPILIAQAGQLVQEKMGNLVPEVQRVMEQAKAEAEKKQNQ